MNSLNRRTYLAGTAAAGLSLAVSTSQAATQPPKIKIGQIGTGHAHAGGVFKQLKQVTDDYELVGIVDSVVEHYQELWL